MSDDDRVVPVEPLRCSRCGKEIGADEARRNQGRCDACAGVLKVSFKGGAAVTPPGDAAPAGAPGVCPVCGSRNVRRSFVKRYQTHSEAACCAGCLLAPILWPLLLALPLFGKGEWTSRCGDCGHEWKS
jgi:DNA-directed RNA polymerase subunit RPC12/RpoP